MVDSHYKVMWAKNSGIGLGRHSTEDYGEARYDPSKQDIISKQRLRFNILVLGINILLTIEGKYKFIAFRTA